jgi:hypothetical protein
LREEGRCRDMNDQDKKHALQTLMDYGRGALDQAQEGREEGWHFAAKHFFAQGRGAADAGSAAEKKEGA